MKKIIANFKKFESFSNGSATVSCINNPTYFRYSKIFYKHSLTPSLVLQRDVVSSMRYELKLTIANFFDRTRNVQRFTI